MDQACNPTAPCTQAPRPPAWGTAALAALLEAVYLVDTAGRITWANPAFERLTGYPVAEVAGQPSVRYYAPEDEPLFLARRRLVYQGESVVPTLDAVFRHQDETLLPVELTVSSLLDGDHVVGRLTVLRARAAAPPVPGQTPATPVATLEQRTTERTAAFHASTLRRAVLNLVQNALEAMAPGGRLTLRGRETATHVELQVQDTGGGIPAERLPQIFEPLHTTKPGGTGLGLYIVREVVHAHGGQVTVASTEGLGTTFTLTLPRAPRAGGLAPVLPASQG